VSHKYQPAQEINRQLQTIVFNATQHFESLKYSGSEFSLDELIDAKKGKEAAPQTKYKPTIK